MAYVKQIIICPVMDICGIPAVNVRQTRKPGLYLESVAVSFNLLFEHIGKYGTLGTRADYAHVAL